MTKEKQNTATELDREVKKDREHQLILINDEVHTFEYVIDALIDVCNHTETQAAQCTMLTHYKGQCDVKHGSFSDLRKMRKALIERELKAMIN